MSIPGITPITGPRDNNRIRGRLTLPKTFDEKKFVGCWALHGTGVQRRREAQIISSERCAADGWQVYKDGGKLVQRVMGKDKYVLMFRPRMLQEAVTKMHANLSRRRINQEAKGETVLGEPRQDHGILTNDVLRRSQLGTEGMDVLELPEHQVTIPNEAARTKASTRVTRKIRQD